MFLAKVRVRIFRNLKHLQLGISKGHKVIAARTTSDSQPKRWASCDKAGVVRFNWRIIQAPTRLVDYVVAHELVHLVHADHTAAFWKRLGRVMPDYESGRAKLRKVGRGMEW